MKITLRAVLVPLALVLTASPVLAYPQTPSSPAPTFPKTPSWYQTVAIFQIVPDYKSNPDRLRGILDRQIDAGLPGQTVGALPGQVVGALPGQIVGPLPGQIVGSLPGQIVGPLPGQLVP